MSSFSYISGFAPFLLLILEESKESIVKIHMRSLKGIEDCMEESLKKLGNKKTGKVWRKLFKKGNLNVK